MSKSPISHALEALTSKKGVMLALPAILLVGGALALGQKPGPTPEPAAPSAAVAAPAVAATAPAEPARVASAAPAGGAFSAEQKRQIEALI
jgi:hypothetical protein